MKSKEDLYLLIKAMSKSEKRYFTLDAQKSGRKGSKYLDVFQAINEQDTYDEAKLKKKFGRHLSHDKHYLYEAILRSMRDYRSAKSYTAQIKEMILDAKYLYERGLYEQSEARLEEAKKLAFELDDQLALLEINRELRSTMWNSSQNFDALLNTLSVEKANNIKALEEEFQYLDIAGKLLLELKRDFDVNRPDFVQEFEEKFPSHLFDIAHEPVALHAKRRYYQSLALYAQLFKDVERVTVYYEKMVEWWDENIKFKNDEFYRYIVDVSNLLHAYASQGNYEKIPLLLERLENEKVSNIHDQGVVFQKVSIYSLMYYINTGFSEGIEKLVQDIDRGLNKYTINPASKIALIFNVAILLFINEKFLACEGWCRKAIKETRSAVRQDIQKGFYVLNLAVSYEIREPEDFDKVVRKTNRYLQKKQGTTVKTFENTVLDFFRRLSYAPISEERKLLRDFLTYLESLKNNQEVKIPLGLDELLRVYVDSKIQKRSISWLLKNLKSA